MSRSNLVRAKCQVLRQLDKLLAERQARSVATTVPLQDGRALAPSLQASDQVGRPVRSLVQEALKAKRS